MDCSHQRQEVLVDITPDEHHYQHQQPSWGLSMASGEGRQRHIYQCFVSFAVSLERLLAPVTALRNHPVQRCYVPGGPGPVQEVENLTILNLDQHWRIELAKARFCDYIASGTREGLILADALGIPGLATAPNLATNHPIGDPAISITNNQIYSRDRAPRLLVALDRHDVDSAQAVVETFPFSLFRRVATLTKPFPRGPSDSNKTLVVILGSLRGGEKSWQSMYTHLLDKNNADLSSHDWSRGKQVMVSLSTRQVYLGVS
jgi:hypothetical protein